MQSDHGHDTPGTGGNDGDEAVWLDLVARLQEPDDGFMDTPDDAGTPVRTDSPGGAEQTDRADPADRLRTKGVNDFDPLGVWRRQGAPMPAEHGGHESTDPGPASGGPRDYDFQAPEEEEDFVPEELPSLAGADPAIMLSWIGAAGGPIFLVLSAIFWRGIPLPGVIGVILAFLAGTGYLIYRLPKNRDHDSGDGAVV